MSLCFFEVSITELAKGLGIQGAIGEEESELALERPDFLGVKFVADFDFLDQSIESKPNRRVGNPIRFGKVLERSGDEEFTAIALFQAVSLRAVYGASHGSLGFFGRSGFAILLCMKVALLVIFCFVTTPFLLGQQSTEEKRLIAQSELKLAEIVIPEVDFVDVPFGDAIAFLRDRSRALDETTDDENLKGLNFLLIPGENPEATQVLITLKLKNVPLGEALRYTTSLAKFKYKVDPHAIVIRP